MGGRADGPWSACLTTVGVSSQLGPVGLYLMVGSQLFLGAPRHWRLNLSVVVYTELQLDGWLVLRDFSRDSD